MRFGTRFGIDFDNHISIKRNGLHASALGLTDCIGCVAVDTRISSGELRMGIRFNLVNHTSSVIAAVGLVPAESFIHTASVASFKRKWSIWEPPKIDSKEYSVTQGDAQHGPDVWPELRVLGRQWEMHVDMQTSPGRVVFNSLGQEPIVLTGLAGELLPFVLLRNSTADILYSAVTPVLHTALAGVVNVRSMTWYSYYRFGVFKSIMNMIMKHATRITLIGIRADVDRRIARVRSSLQDLRDAVRDKKAPFWKDGNEVVPWAMLEERRVDINALEEVLQQASTGSNRAILVSCADQLMTEAEATVKDHNGKDDVNDVDVAWATRDDVYNKARRDLA